MNFFDSVFIISSMAFNILVSGIYLAQRFDKQELTQRIGLFVVLLLIPYAVVLINYIVDKKETINIIGLIVICLYLIIELLLDFILKIEFRENLVAHVAYIILFYIVAYFIIKISFNIDRTAGWAVAITFWVLLGFLVYLLTGK